MSQARGTEEFSAARKNFVDATQNKCCDEWPECTHVLNAYERMKACEPATPNLPASQDERER